MNPNEYQRQAQQYALFPLDDSGWDYLLSAIPEEVGEFSSIFAKAARKGRGRNLTAEEKANASSEIGDILWDLGMACKLLDTTLGAVMAHNLNKLEERKRNNVIEGSGESIQERLA